LATEAEVHAVGNVMALNLRCDGAAHDGHKHHCGDHGPEDAKRSHRAAPRSDGHGNRDCDRDDERNDDESDQQVQPGGARLDSTRDDAVVTPPDKRFRQEMSGKYERERCQRPISAPVDMTSRVDADRADNSATGEVGKGREAHSNEYPVAGVALTPGRLPGTAAQ
jgi:hypothetical protein